MWRMGIPLRSCVGQRESKSGCMALTPLRAVIGVHITHAKACFGLAGIALIGNCKIGMEGKGLSKCLNSDCSDFLSYKEISFLKSILRPVLNQPLIMACIFSGIMQGVCPSKPVWFIREAATPSFPLLRRQTRGCLGPRVGRGWILKNHNRQFDDFQIVQLSASSFLLSALTTENTPLPTSEIVHAQGALSLHQPETLPPLSHPQFVKSGYRCIKDIQGSLD